MDYTMKFWRGLQDLERFSWHEGIRISIEVVMPRYWAPGHLAYRIDGTYLRDTVRDAVQVIRYVVRERIRSAANLAASLDDRCARTAELEEHV